jgi:hypothetical protein
MSEGKGFTCLSIASTNLDKLQACFSYTFTELVFYKEE